MMKTLQQGGITFVAFTLFNGMFLHLYDVFTAVFKQPFA